MKNLIIGAALVILLMAGAVYQEDNDLFLRMQEDLKYQADDMAAAAVLFYDQDAYGRGVKIFDYTTGNQTAKELLEKNLHVKNNTSVRGYWRGNRVDYYIYYFDDSGKCQTYKNGILIQTADFVYGSIFTEPLTGVNKLIFKPSAIVTIDAGRPHYRLTDLRPIPAIQTSAYEYVD